jgi:hypothetical protein
MVADPAICVSLFAASPVMVMSGVPSLLMSPSMVSASLITSVVPGAYVSRIVPPDRLFANVIVSAPAFTLASAIASRSDRPELPGAATVAPASFSSASVVTV